MKINNTIRRLQRDAELLRQIDAVKKALLAGDGTDYAAQILAEQKEIDERGREAWVNIHQRANHLLDAEILAAACMEMEFPGGGLRILASRPAKDRSIASRPDDDGHPGPARTNVIHRDAPKGWFSRR